MRRRLGLLLGCVLLVLALAAVGAARTTTGSRRSATIKVGFVYVSPLHGSGWTLAWNRARLAIQKQLNVQTTYVEPIAETADLVPVLNNLIGKGYNVIFATAFGYQPFVHQVAQQHPDVKFIVTGPNT